MASTVVLKPGRDKPIAQGHPWVFSGAVAEVQGDRTCGAVTEVVSSSGTWLGRGLMHPNAALAVRIYTRDQQERIDAALFHDRLARAVSLREVLFARQADEGETNAYRLLYSEADGVSGLIVDRFADTLVVQVESQVLVPQLDAILESLKSLTRTDRLLVRADLEAARREGMDSDAVAARSTTQAESVTIRESGRQFRVNLTAGQKTGFFLDQRVNRQRVARYARGRRMLSAYCYTGAFEVYAATEGAIECVGVDTSAAALGLAEEHYAMNGLATPHRYLRQDVPTQLRTFRDSRECFDLVVLDPPRFVANRNQKPKGLRAYKDINLWGLKLLRPGGILATFSCSGLVELSDFEEVLRWAAHDAGRQVRMLETLSQPPDHPILPNLPESRYLKGFICWAE